MLFHKIYIYCAEYNDSDFTRKCGFSSHNGPCESVAGFWGFVYGRDKWLCSVQEVQLAVISDPFLRCEVSCAHVFYTLSLYCIMSWIDFDWRYKYVLCHGNRGQNNALEGLEEIWSQGRSDCVSVIWVASSSVSAVKYKQTQGHCSLIQTNIPPSGFLQDLLISYLSVCTSFFPIFPECRWWSHGFISPSLSLAIQHFVMR